MHASTNQAIIDSSNDPMPFQHQDIISTNAGLLAIGPLGTNLCEIWFKMKNFHSRKLVWKCHLQNGRNLLHNYGIIRNNQVTYCAVLITYKMSSNSLTLVQFGSVMAASQTAPSCYLNHCWFVIHEILWHLYFSGNAQTIRHVFKIQIQK